MTEETSNADAADVAVNLDNPAWESALSNVNALVEQSARAALGAVELPVGPLEISFLLSDDATVQDLNKRYRDQDKATNVLSFAALDATEEEFRPPEEPLLLGDVIFALETIQREASAQGKALSDHLSHLTIHGVLHLLGYDHISDEDAVEMESLETEILKGLGIENPYA
jgi:probable rRNA maturation factor